MERSVVVIGEFDGFHAGHQALVEEAVGVSALHRLPLIGVVLCDPTRTTRQLVEPARRCELLVAAGVDAARLLEVPSGDPERVAAAVTDAICDALAPDAALLACPPDQSTLRYPALRPALASRRVHIIEVPRVLGPDLVPVTSEAIVAALAAGDVTRAARMLGRAYTYDGPVTLGDQRGRLLGFPTANLAVEDDRAIPADGVYAGWVQRSTGELWPAAINVGRRPTFYAQHGQQLIEAHLIGFDGDLYAERVSMRFIARIRDEQRFASVQLLQDQLSRDVEAARGLLDGAT